MAKHLRTQIREATATALASLTTTGSNVFESRVYSFAVTTLPSLVIYTKSETVAPDTVRAADGLMRRLDLVIEGYAKSDTATLDDTLDEINKEVEIALAAVPTLGGLCLDQYLRTVDIDLTAEGETPAGVITMIFEVTYRTLATAPDAAA